MLKDQDIDDLIQAGWDVLDSDFAMSALLEWKRKAHTCLSGLLGPDHAYTQHFQGYVGQAARTQERTESGTTDSGIDSHSCGPVISSDRDCITTNRTTSSLTPVCVDL